MARETGVQSQVESYQRLKKWYLIPPCLTLSIIRYVSRVKWSNPWKRVTPSPTPWCSSYWKGSFCLPSTTVVKNLQLARYYLFYLCREQISSEFPACVTEGWLLQTSLHNWTNVVRKICWHQLWGEDSVKLAYKVELLSRNHCWGSKPISKGYSGPRRTKNIVDR